MKRYLSLIILIFLSLGSVTSSKKHDCPSPCPNTGCGGDRALDAQKNRRATPTAGKIKDLDSLDDLAALEKVAPKNGWTAGKPRKELTDAGEGQPVRVVAFLIKARPQSGESCNCWQSGDANHDVHLVLVHKRVLSKSSLEERELVSQTAEMTPAFRAKHTNWVASKIEKLIEDAPRQALFVRMTGYQMFDSEHLIRFPLTRKNNWEIHPVTQFEICETGDRCDARSEAGWKKLP